MIPREFRVAAKPAKYEWMTGRACFENAFLLVTASSVLRYGEGCAFVPFPSGGFWLHHAWAVDLADTVIDVTWRDPGLRYIGITVPPDRLRKRQRQKKNPCQIDPVLRPMLTHARGLQDMTWDPAPWFAGAPARET